MSDSLDLALTPRGALDLVSASASDDGLGGEFAERFRDVFARGAHHALLDLGAAEWPDALPPAMAWFRDLARLFITRLCGSSDLEERRADIEVPIPVLELAALAESAPPMRGAEYLDVDVLASLWAGLLHAFRDEIAAWSGPVQEWLRAKDPVWHVVGRVHFHLAERKDDDARPFAFLATYTTRVGPAARPQHKPLGPAVTDSAGARDSAALLSLLKPVHLAAEQCALIRSLVESREIFHPLAWTPEEAYRFLVEVPVCEAAGVIVRVPDWWHARRQSRPQVTVKLGDGEPSRFGVDALLDFRVDVTLGGEALTKAELKQLLDGGDGLVRLRGRWVEIDKEQLGQVLGHWKKVEAEAGQGLSFIEGMRLLAGARISDADGDEGSETVTSWSEVHAGKWLADMLASVRDHRDLGERRPIRGLNAELRPYQRVGTDWLAFLSQLGLGAVLADDMGLGKTIQVIALLLARKNDGARAPSLLVVPASLIANWQAELARFAPGLVVFVAHPSARPAAELKEMGKKELAGVDVVITSYGTAVRHPGMRDTAWGLAVLDEAQAIKNAGAQQARAVKELKAEARIALTGTPIENRLGDLWSLFDFLNPGLLGSAKEFGSFVKRAQRAMPPDFGPLRALVRPYVLRRLKTDRRVISDLPDKSEVKAWCALSKVQAALYQESVEALAQAIRSTEGIQRRGVVLAYLMRFKQICNHPSQWLGDGRFVPATSGKFGRLAEICEELAERQEKALVFTQFQQMTEPLATFLASVFGREGIVLDGKTPVRERQKLVERFQKEEAVPFFVLSVKAGGTGLNLTAASHVIHFDRWWNPAVENQATDRAFRIGQTKNVLVHKFVCRGTLEEKIDALIEGKSQLARDVLDGGSDRLVTEMSDSELLDFVALDLRRATGDA